MKIRQKKRIVGVKILFISIFFGVGLGFVIVGSIDYGAKSYLKTDQDFAAIINENNKMYEVGGLFQTPDGIMENRPINAQIWIKIPEDNNNTTAEISFPNAKLRDRVLIEDPKVDRVALFHLKEKTDDVSTYESIPLLIYNKDGSYGMVLEIKDGDYQIHKEYSDVVQVRSWDDYKAEKRDNESEGLAWMIIGITLISIATVFTSVVDLFTEFYTLRKDEFYE